ncbi:MAG TPA: rhodanese-like domain-containing protein [Alphaproteobacteria bacterium]
MSDSGSAASLSAHDYAGDIDARKAWEILEKDKKAVLVDVRTRPEWEFVGVPDLSRLDKELALVPWQVYPSMQVNSAFADEIKKAGVPGDATLLFICRSGARSKAAAIAMTQAGFRSCYNVAGGFEGPPDPERHRGRVDGWKALGLPWTQG